MLALLRVVPRGWQGFAVLSVANLGMSRQSVLLVNWRNNKKKNDWMARVLILSSVDTELGLDRVILTICNVKSKECVGGMTVCGTYLRIRQS